MEMTPVEFCYWLKGYFDINHAGRKFSGLDDVQTAAIKDKLNLVFEQKEAAPDWQVVRLESNVQGR